MVASCLIDDVEDSIVREQCNRQPNARILMAVVV